MSLHDELHRIADRAPVADVPSDTWRRARRARTRDRVLALAAAAVVALIAGAVTWLPDRAEPPVAGTDSLGVPDRLYAVPERMSDRENDGSWMRDEITDDPTVVGVGAAAWVTYGGLPVVVGAADGRYHLLDLPGFAGNNENFARGLGTPVVALSPDGRRLAYGYAEFGPDSDTEPIPSGIRVVDLTTGELREIPVPGEEGTAVSHIEWSPDGSWLAFTGMQQSTWTKQSMGTSSYLDDAGPVLGRVAPGSHDAEVKRVTNDDGKLAVEDDGGIVYDNGSNGGHLRVWGPASPRQTTERHELEALGLLPDGRWLMRTGTADNDVLSVTDPDTGRRAILIDIIGIDGSLSVATYLMPPGRPTVTRPEPEWPMSEERLSLVIGLGVAAAVTVLLVGRHLLGVLRRRSAR